MASNGGISLLPDYWRERLEKGLPPPQDERSKKGEVKTVQWMNRDMSVTTWESEDGRMWRGWTVPRV